MRLWHKSDNGSNFDEFLVDTYAYWVSRLVEMFDNAWFLIMLLMVRWYDGLPNLAPCLDRQRDTNNTEYTMGLWHKRDNRSNFNTFLVDTYAWWISGLVEMFEDA